MLWILVARNTAWKETGMRHAVLGRRHVFRRQIGRTSRWTCLTLDVPPHVQAGRASHCTTVQSDDLNDELLKSQLRYLESDELELKYREYVQSTDGRRQTYSWAEFKLLADAAAGPVDPRVTPMYATLTLSFVAQGTQFPVLPLLARSFELSPADLGLVTAATAAARLVTNAPAANLAERLGRKPLLIAGPLMAAGGCGVLGVATTFSELVVANLCVGAGLATTMAGASTWPTSPRRATAPRRRHPSCRVLCLAMPSALLSAATSRARTECRRPLSSVQALSWLHPRRALLSFQRRCTLAPALPPPLAPMAAKPLPASPLTVVACGGS